VIVRRLLLGALVCAVLAVVAWGSGEDTSTSHSVKGAVAEEEASGCDPNYAGACLDPYASDYDCAGGSGNGPDYTGTVTVVGEDHYGLDADGDRTGCEAE